MLKNTVFLIFSFLLISTQSFARDLKDYIIVTGEVNPEFSVKITDSELQKIVDTLKELDNNLKPTPIDINDLFRPGDKRAIAKASGALSKSFKIGAQKIADLKAMTYKLAQLLTLNESTTILDESKKSLYRAYSILFQNTYNEFIESFLNVDVDIVQAIKLCQSEICVMTIHSAKQELIDLGKAFNTGLDVDDLDDSELKWQFNNYLNLAVIEKTWEAIVPDNERVSAYSTLLAAILKTFVAAAGTGANLTKLIFEIITGPGITKLELEAHPLKNTKFETQEFVLADFADRKINSIVLSIPLYQVGHVKAQHRVNTLRCANRRKQKSGSHLFLYGKNSYNNCTNLKMDDFNIYSLRVRTFGLGLSIGSFHEVYVLVTSAIDLNPAGTWYGAGAEAAVFYGLTVGTYPIGKGASLATLFGYGEGLGAAAGVGSLSIEIKDVQDR